MEKQRKTSEKKKTCQEENTIVRENKKLRIQQNIEEEKIVTWKAKNLGK